MKNIDVLVNINNKMQYSWGAIMALLPLPLESTPLFPSLVYTSNHC